MASYFCESYSLVLIRFGYKFHNAAQVNIMSSTLYIIVTGMVPFQILEKFQFIYLSTEIFAISFLFLISDLVIWFFKLAAGGTINLEERKSKSF